MTREDKSMGQVIRSDEGRIKDHLGEMVRGTLEEVLNAEAGRLSGEAKYECTEARKDTRADSYKRSLQTKAGEGKLIVPKLRHLTFETTVIKRYRRRKSSLEETLIERYLAGVSIRRVEDIAKAVWGTKVSPSTVLTLNKKICEKIEARRNVSIAGEYPYPYLDGILMKRSWAGKVCNVSLLAAIWITSESLRKVLGICDGAKEDKSGCSGVLRHLLDRGLEGVELTVPDACWGGIESVAAEYPSDARRQRCTVHFDRNVFGHVPKVRVRNVAHMLKAIHAQESNERSPARLRPLSRSFAVKKLGKAADLVEKRIQQTSSSYSFPDSHWRKLRTNNPLERLMREIRRRSRLVGAFPDDKSFLNLDAARLHHIADTQWSVRKYMNTKPLREIKLQTNGAAVGLSKARKILDIIGMPTSRAGVRSRSV